MNLVKHEVVFNNGVSVNAIVIQAPSTTSKLWTKGTIECSVKYTADGEYVVINTDTASSDGVWSGSSDGNISYHKTIQFDAPTTIYAVKVVYTRVWRVSSRILVRNIQ